MGRPGRARLTWHGPAVTAAEREGAARGLRRAAELVADTSDRLAPRDSGEMVATRQVSVDEGRLTAEVSYGSSGLPRAYTVRQHEDLTLEHPGGGQSKFLESALQRHRGDVLDLIAGAIRRELS